MKNLFLILILFGCFIEGNWKEQQQPHQLQEQPNPLQQTQQSEQLNEKCIFFF